MDEFDVLKRMAEAQERIAAALEHKPQGGFSRALATGAAVATALGVFSVIDIVIKWIGG